MLRIMKLLRNEVPAGMGGTLNFMSCDARYFMAAPPPLHVAKPNFINIRHPLRKNLPINDGEVIFYSSMITGRIMGLRLVVL